MLGLDRRDPPEVERVAEADGCGIAAATPEPGPSGQAVESSSHSPQEVRGVPAVSAAEPADGAKDRRRRRVDLGLEAIGEDAAACPVGVAGDGAGVTPARLEIALYLVPECRSHRVADVERRPGISRVASLSRQTTELRSPSASGRAMAAESGVTGVDPERAQSRGEHRHWEDPAPAQAELVGHEVEDLAVGEDFGPPMSIVSPLVAGVASASTR